MGASFLEAFRSCRGLQYFIPRSPEDRGGEAEKLGIIVGDEYFGSTIYFLPLI
jgi:hypothetical protein